MPGQTQETAPVMFPSVSLRVTAFVVASLTLLQQPQFVLVVGSLSILEPFKTLPQIFLLKFLFASFQSCS